MAHRLLRWSSSETHPDKASRMRIASLMTVLLFLTAAPCAAQESPKAQVQQVVDRFQASLKAKDTQALGELFLPESKAWITTLGEPSFSEVKAKHPEVPRYKAGSLQEFTDFVGKAKGSVEERFHDVRIETDGSVASVYFDFEFLMDGKVGNHGAETWQLVRTDQGWKIAAMLYSSNF
jgi:ketosteroid isomerase-like protein